MEENSYKVTYLRWETIKAVIVKAHDMGGVLKEYSKRKDSVSVGYILKIELIIDAEV